MADEIFGHAFHGGMLVRPARNTLDEWLPTYLHFWERKTGRQRNSLAPIAWWRAEGRLTREGDEPPPVGLIISPGLAEPPDRERGQVYRGQWRLAFAAIIGTGGGQDETVDTAMVYAAAVRMVLTHKGDLGGVAARTRWVDESYDDLDPVEDRTVAIATVHFVVDVPDVMDEGPGPAEPDSEPYGPLPVMTSFDLDVEPNPDPDASRD